MQLKIVYKNKLTGKEAYTIYQQLTEEEDISGIYDINKYPIEGYEGNWIPLQIYDYDGNIVRDYYKGKVIIDNRGNKVFDNISSNNSTIFMDFTKI